MRQPTTQNRVIKTKVLDCASFLIASGEVPIAREMDHAHHELTWSFAGTENARHLIALFGNGSPAVELLRRYAFARDDERKAIALMRRSDRRRL